MMDIRTVAFILCSLLEISRTHGAALKCGGALAEPKGEFFSPNYPDPYPVSINCTWTIQSTGNRIVELTFPFMQLEYVNWDADCRFDSISVYDGPASEHRLLGKLCGNETRPINSTRNELTVVFTSDSTFPKKGFHANYSFVGERKSNIPLTQGKALKYVPFLSELVTPSPELKDVKCGGEWTVSEGGFTSPCGVCLFMVHSLFSSEDVKCGGEWTVSEGGFTSPNYPHHYPNKAHCTWTIKSTGNRIVELTFPTVELESDWMKDCRFDSIKVFDGPASEQRLIGLLCGTQTGNFTSTRNELTVVFSSDSSTSHPGFKAQYRFVDVPSLSEYPTPVPTNDTEETSKCGSVMVEPKGEFFSPNYPEPYPNHAKCTWSIQSAGDHLIELDFPFMLVEYRQWDGDCRFDAVSVYDGPLADDKLLNRLCGNHTAISVKSTKNEMTVVFTSDSTFSYKGFHAHYSFADKP
ncbi:deleted in malignant brain tumors 1 protein-like isoform X2 [Alosa sapidissima]|uniref:deleted in malignant brain tumors 1 protein-like isoform X2 n=1 Tax=Alosa sapidissima TaxID=34773 RepID=UPI001C089ED5|nr:deleted in malignant brain tumors 1 protein-like isoform X2 [Alosa sapidissima]